MLITNVTGNYFLKQNDTATEIHLAVIEVDGTPVDLSTAPRVEVVIGTLLGRILVKEPTILSAPGELTFGLDPGDILPVGDNLVEVHIYQDNGEKRVAPSKGHYKLRVQQAIDDLDAVVTTITLDYFLSEVNRITFGLPELMERAVETADRMDDLLEASETLITDTEISLQQAQASKQLADEALLTISPILQDTKDATDDATLAAELANDIADDLLGYNIAISDFSLDTTYIKYQPVRANGTLYRAKVETTGNPLPVAPATSNEWFELVAEKGAKGDKGEKGDKGDKGDTGEKGEQGSGVNVIDELSDPSQLPAAGTTGEAYIINGSLWVWTELGTWKDVGNIKGPAGSDANVTASNIEGALGYVPASSNDLAALDTEVKNHQDRRDNPHAVTKNQVGLPNVQNYSVATQAEAEAGASATKYMTPQRTKQAIDGNLVTISQTVTNLGEQVAQHLDEKVTNGVHGMGSAAAQNYEEGVWTPTLAGQTTEGSNSYTIREGKYIKIGKLVIATCNIQLSAKGSTMAGSVMIKGLPFATGDVTHAGASVNFSRYIDFPVGFQFLAGTVIGTSIFVHTGVGKADIYLQTSAITNTTALSYTAIYRIA